MRFLPLLAAALLPILSYAGAATVHLATLQRRPAAFAGVALSGAQATLEGSDRWSFLVGQEALTDARVSVTYTIQQPATVSRFFGQGWSVWPDATYSDGGFEAALLLAAGENNGFRVQVSHKYQQLALVKWPDGGYLRVVDCAIKQGQPQTLAVTRRGNVLSVSLDGIEKIHYRDDVRPLGGGQAGFGVAGQARVSFENFSEEALPAQKDEPAVAHVPSFSARKFLGGRAWVFDGDEPILLLPVPEASFINNVKLRPGYKPQLGWNSHWDVQNQGAYREADNTVTAAVTSGGGASLDAKWESHHVQERFVVRTAMKISYDPGRDAYVYAIESELEVGKEPFFFRYGYDFEHHTPLDPFQWQYLVARRADQSLYFRPIYPIDPGPQLGLAQSDGLRVWYGRHNEQMLIAPAVEYTMDPRANLTSNQKGELVPRKINTAVCAAFYDTGVAYEPETAPAGTKVHVQYRYTGYPAAEAETYFKSAAIYPAPTLDPQHHYIFADEWPKLTFSQFKPMSETWVGRTPFITTQGQRPTYDLVQNAGAGSGYAMRLGPASYGKAPLKPTAPLEPGRYTLSALVKSINTHGPGGRIELEVLAPKTNAVLAQYTHYVGRGTFDWKPVRFGFDVPARAGALRVAFGNAGTGEMQITEVAFAPLDPATPASDPDATPPAFAPAPPHAIADYRMEEGRDLAVFDSAGGPFGQLGLANLDWVTDAGHAALRFSDNTTGRTDAFGAAARYLDEPSYRECQHQTAVAIAGHHGGSMEISACTLSAWIKPAAQMGTPKSPRGDLIGLGARRAVLSLAGPKPPYQLMLRLDVNETFKANTELEADRWYHVAATAEPTPEKKWKISLYVDGARVLESISEKSIPPLRLPPSLVCGAELFYLHEAYYRGLLGRVTVFDRALSEEEIKQLAAP